MPSWVPGAIIAIFSAILTAAITVTKMGGRFDLIHYRVNKLETFQGESREPIHWARNQMANQQYVLKMLEKICDHIERNQK